MINDENNFFDQLTKIAEGIYKNLRRIKAYQIEGCTARSILDYPCFRESYKLIAAVLWNKVFLLVFLLLFVAAFLCICNNAEKLY